MLQALKQYSESMQNAAAIEEIKELEDRLAEKKRELAAIDFDIQVLKTRVIEPLATELSQRVGLQCVVYGPLGLRNEMRSS